MQQPRVIFEFPFTPIPKQSVEYGTGKNGKLRAYQPTKLVEAKNLYITYIKKQLPRNHILWDTPIELYVEFIFELPKSAPNSVRGLVVGGERVYKITRPDATDNLWKLPVDCMTGLLFTEDSRVCITGGHKLYGIVPKTVIIATSLTNVHFYKGK